MNRTAGSKPKASDSAARFRRRHREAMRNAFARLRERPLAHGFALALLSVALLTLLLLKFGLDQFDRLGSPLAGARTLSLFLVPGIDDVSARALAAEFAADARVADVSVISPAEGLRELAHIDGSEEALATLSDDPLPWVMAVEPKDREAGEILKTEWAAREEIEYIADESEWRRQADAVMKAARAVAVAVALFIAVATLLIVANAVRTIRVEGASERNLQRVFGASEADLRRPYVYLGLLYGLIAGVLAVLLALAIRLALTPAFASLASVFGSGSSSRDDAWLWWLAFVPGAALLGAIGAWLGCRFERDLEVAE